jgi:pilus assembly protein Flp/PilA
MTRSLWYRLLIEEDGPTASEYAFLLALILMAVIASVTAVGNSTSAIWGSDSNQISSACNGS